MLSRIQSLQKINFLTKVSYRTYSLVNPNRSSILSSKKALLPLYSRVYKRFSETKILSDAEKKVKEISTPNPEKIVQNWIRELSGIAWHKLPEKIVKFKDDDLNSIPEWFPSGQINLAYNCLVHNKNDAKKAISYYNKFSKHSGFLTYKQLRDKVNMLSGIIKHLDINKGDRVIIQISNSVEYVVSVLACLQIGAIFHAIPPGLGSARLQQKIQDMTPKLILTCSSSRNCFIDFFNFFRR